MAMIAPRRARKSPYNVCFPRSQSPQPIRSPPPTATRMEKNRGNERRSRRKKTDARATKIGFVVTKMTELATEVYFNEVTQTAK